MMEDGEALKLYERQLSRDALEVENQRLSAALRAANAQAGHFERLWYLQKDDSDRYVFGKTLEGQCVVMETLKSKGAEALDQALDDAMAEYANDETQEDVMRPCLCNERTFCFCRTTCEAETPNVSDERSPL
jgi:hypothetical protein